jgi:predicted MFS family arabinose efflux permease
MIDERPLGIVIAVVGAVGTLIAVFADPLGIGEGHVFGWLQITGTILGALVTLVGLAMAMEWVPYPGRRPRADTTSTSQTTAVSGSSTPDQRP